MAGFGSPFIGVHCQSGDPLFSRALHTRAFSTLTEADVMLVSGALGRSTGAGVVPARLSSVTVGWGLPMSVGVVTDVGGESLADDDWFRACGRATDASVIPRLCTANATATTTATPRAAIATVRGGHVHPGLSTGRTGSGGASASGSGDEGSSSDTAAGGFQKGISCAAQKSTRFLRLVVTNGCPGRSDATAIAWARR